MTDPSGEQPTYPSWPDPTAAPQGTPQPPTGGVPGYQPPPGYPTPAYPTLPGYPTQAAYPTEPAYPALPGAFYPVSGYGYGPAGYPVPGSAPDPMVTWPGEGFAGWWHRVWATLGRSFGTLVAIALLTSAVPSFLFTLATTGLQAQMLVVDTTTNPQTVHFEWGPGREYLAWFAAYWVLTIFLGALGWSASVWAITKRSAGADASLGAALAYGLRNCLRVGGALLPCSLMVIVGLVACVLPGLYLAVATSLVVPVALYQRSSAISGTFRMVHAGFGAVLGRLAAIGGLLIGAALVVSCLVGVATGSTSRATRFGAVDLFRDGVTGLLSAVLTSILVVAVALTYAEMRARFWPTTVHELSAALDG